MTIGAAVRVASINRRASLELCLGLRRSARRTAALGLFHSRSATRLDRSARRVRQRGTRPLGRRRIGNGLLQCPARWNQSQAQHCSHRRDSKSPRWLQSKLHRPLFLHSTAQNAAYPVTRARRRSVHPSDYQTHQQDAGLLAGLPCSRERGPSPPILPRRADRISWYPCHLSSLMAAKP